MKSILFAGIAANPLLELLEKHLVGKPVYYQLAFGQPSDHKPDFFLGKLAEARRRGEKSLDVTLAIDNNKEGEDFDCLVTTISFGYDLVLMMPTGIQVVKQGYEINSLKAPYNVWLIQLDFKTIVGEGIMTQAEVDALLTEPT